MKQILKRSIRLRCPRCGEGEIYVRWNELRDRCEVCSCKLHRREEDAWFLIYITTAGLTGVIVVVMLLVHVQDLLTGQIAVLVVWFFVIMLTLPLRKSIAIGIDYYFECRSHRKEPG